MRVLNLKICLVNWTFVQFLLNNEKYNYVNNILCLFVYKNVFYSLKTKETKYYIKTY